MENIEETNKLIAEFMGYKLQDLGDGKSPYYNHLDKYIKPCAIIRLDKGESLQFHSSWDWLMPVVEKIESLDICDIKIVKDGCYTDWQKFKIYPEIYNTGTTFSKLQAVYDTVVFIIKWYNGAK